jgi:UDP-arabinose 4-epimerase
VFADVSKIRDELGWSAKYTDLEESMRHAWNWRKMHPNGY